MTKLVFLDADHTIADSQWRDYKIKPEMTSEDWIEYHWCHDQDSINKEALEFLNLTIFPITTVLLTSRNEMFRHQTENWFMKHGVYLHDFLMRPKDNFEEPAFLKERLIRNYLGKSCPKIYPMDCLLIDDDFLTVKHITEKLRIPSILWPRPRPTDLWD